MKRKLAIWLSWHNFSEYYSRQLAHAIADEYDTTITYLPLDWDEFDVVMPFFPGPNRNPDCAREKVVKFVWEPHEDSWAEDAGTVCAASTTVYGRIKERYGDRTVLLPWGVNPEHFSPQPFPTGERKVGWCGQWQNPRKQYQELRELVESIPNVAFTPNLTQMRGGKVSGEYELETMYEYYRQIHVYVCASASEGFCFPLLEASACGRPVVTFDVGCAMDLNDTGAGILIVRDWQELREAIQEQHMSHWYGNHCHAGHHLLGAKSANAVDEYWLWSKLRDRWLEMLDNASSPIFGPACIGSYVGDGSDNQFVYTGFGPCAVVVKAEDDEKI